MIGAVDRKPDATDSETKASYFEGVIADFRTLDRAVSDPEAKLLALWDGVESSRGKRAAELSDRERQALRQYYLVRQDRDFQRESERLTALQIERLNILRRTPVTHVQQEQDSEAFAHVLYRGMYDQPREKSSLPRPACCRRWRPSSRATGWGWRAG